MLMAGGVFAAAPAAGGTTPVTMPVWSRATLTQMSPTWTAPSPPVTCVRPVKHGATLKVYPATHFCPWDPYRMFFWCAT